MTGRQASQSDSNVTIQAIPFGFQLAFTLAISCATTTQTGQQQSYFIDCRLLIIRIQRVIAAHTRQICQPFESKDCRVSLCASEHPFQQIYKLMERDKLHRRKNRLKLVDQCDDIRLLFISCENDTDFNLHLQGSQHIQCCCYQWQWCYTVPILNRVVTERNGLGN